MCEGMQCVRLGLSNENEVHCTEATHSHGLHSIALYNMHAWYLAEQYHHVLMAQKVFPERDGHKHLLLPFAGCRGYGILDANASFEACGTGPQKSGPACYQRNADQYSEKGHHGEGPQVSRVLLSMPLSDSLGEATYSELKAGVQGSVSAWPACCPERTGA